MTKSIEDKYKIYSFDNYYDFKNFIFYQMGHGLLKCLKNDKGSAIFQYFKISQNFKTFPPTLSPIHTNCIIFIVVTYAQFNSNIRVLYVFLGFLKNMAQNMQSGKGYAKNH